MKVAHAKFTVRHAQAVACSALFILAACERPAAVDSQRPTSAAAPPLAGSPALADSARMFKIILQGQSNESVVNGQKFGGIMPGMAYLTDEEIAAVIAYLRQRFGSSPEAIDPAQVAAERKRLGVD